MNRPTNLNVFIYLRKSRRDIEEEQKAATQGRSYDTLDRHRKQLFNLAKEEKHTILNVYEEVVSGEYLDQRPKMQEMLRDLQHQPVDAVLVMDLDRLGRGDMADQGTIYRILKYTETLIITPLEVIDPADETQELTFSIKSIIAREELKQINKRLIRGRNQSAREGKFIAAKPPYGYLKDENLKLIPDPKTAWVVQMIFDMFVREGKLRAEIAEHLNRLNIPSPRGKKWTDNGIMKILKREAYAGDIVYRKSVLKKGNERASRTYTDKNALIIAKDAHEPLVSREVFERAQEIMSQRFRPPKNKTKPLANPLAGILKCEVCGHSMERNYSPQRNGDIYHYYRCISTQCRTQKTQKSAKMEYVEEAVITGLRELMKQLKIASKQTKKEPVMIQNFEKILEEKRKELYELEKQKENLHDLLEKEVYDIHTFMSRQQHLGNRIREKQQEIFAIEEQINQEKEKNNKDLNAYVKQVEHVIDAYLSTDDVQKKNHLLKSVLEKVTYRRLPESTDPRDFIIQLYPKI
ncbi:recombinase family protein [Thermaerobacillus caldiproteolyticus]|uniref:DNA invertase Pin-like site-specific DNA recombinase n=1 Tax=Thermaerobacillus caldiproteolyticus TaxID=247480 RepID=A0A7W0C0C5_9BACL|nr:recombinase family protein [Anoxybacillus caldiproteolyticus]MBA2875456.1 DNA invertase Pin-like site-specific DNA recombinase [Anoxybacillus caldiproteolyticus]